MIHLLNTRPNLRRLFWDIETSPNIVLSWRVGRKINIDSANLLHERAIICIAWKWENENTVFAATWDQHQSDRSLVARFLKVASQADELVAHNGDRFDAPWFRTRCIFHSLPPPAPLKTIDTLQLAKRNFYFNSNRMDYISKYLGMEGKLPHAFDLWKDVVLKNDRGALKNMVAYCKQDVGLLERVYHRLAGYVRPKTHLGVFGGRDKWTCPRCGSAKVKKNKLRVTAAGTMQHQMQCCSCGGYFSISDKAHSDYIESQRRARRPTCAKAA